MRLFIAINIPGEMRDEIWKSAAPLRARGSAVRWVAPEAMHLTLKFLGEVPADRERTVGDALASAAAGVTPFDLQLRGFGAFPNTRVAKVIWLGCEVPATLRLLQRQVEEELGEVGFPRDTRRFHPHLTLGRLGRNAGSSQLKETAGLLGRLEFVGDVFVRSVELMRSELKPSGANYTIRKSVELSK